MFPKYNKTKRNAGDYSVGRYSVAHQYATNKAYQRQKKHQKKHMAHSLGVTCCTTPTTPPIKEI